MLGEKPYTCEWERGYRAEWALKSYDNIFYSWWKYWRDRGLTPDQINAKIGRPEDG